MENGVNPMSQLPQLLEALLMRLEVMLADAKNKEQTEILLQKLKKQAAAMRAIVSSTSGETLTEEQTETISKVPVPPINLFPSWVVDNKEK